MTVRDDGRGRAFAPTIGRSVSDTPPGMRSLSSAQVRDSASTPAREVFVPFASVTVSSTSLSTSTTGKGSTTPTSPRTSVTVPSRPLTRP